MSSKRPGALIVVPVVVALACGLAIASVFQGTAARIAENRQARLQAAVAEVLPGATHQRGFAVTDGGLVDVEVARAAMIAGYDASGALVGVAVPARVMGYQDTISLLLGYDPDAQRVIGVTVLESRETPGLGAKIGSDPSFLAGFSALDVTLAADAVERPVSLTPTGAERMPWQVDGITGATISSRAVVHAVNTSAPAFAKIRSRLEELRRAG